MGAEGGVALEAPPATTAQAPAMEAQSAPDIQSENLVNDLQQRVENMQQAELSAEPQSNSSSNLDTGINSPAVEDANTAGNIQKNNIEEPAVIPGTEAQAEKDLQNDPIYQKCLGEVTANAIGKGEPLDGKKLQEAALAKYQQEKTTEPAENIEQQTVDKKMEEAAKRIGALLENNKENLESAMVTVSAADLATLLKALAEAKEPNQKKKETKLQLVLKLLGMLVLSGVMETAKTVTPPTSQG